MTDSTLTFAELAALSLHSPHRDELHDLLSIPASDEGVVAAGIASLLARGLAKAQPGGLAIRDDVRARVDLLWTPAHVITLTRGDDTGLNVAFVLVPDDAGRTVVVSLVQPGVFDITPLAPAGNVAVQLRDFVLALAGEGRAAVALGPKDSSGEIILGHDQGRWSLGRSTQPPAEHPQTTDREAVGAALDQWLQVWLTR